MKNISPTSVPTVAASHQVWTWQQATIPSGILLVIALFGAATGSRVGLLELGITPVVVFLYSLFFGKLLSRAGYSGWWMLALFVPILNFVVIILAEQKDKVVEAKRVAPRQQLVAVQHLPHRASPSIR